MHATKTSITQNIKPTNYTTPNTIYVSTTYNNNSFGPNNANINQYYQSRQNIPMKKIKCLTSWHD